MSNVCLREIRCYADRLRTPVVILLPISAREFSNRCNRLRFAWLYQEILLTLQPLSGELNSEQCRHRNTTYR